MENGHKEEAAPNPDRDQFQEVLAYIEKTDLEYVEIEKDGRKICLKRLSNAVAHHHAPAAAASSADEAEKPAEPDFFAIRSPIVGRFHSSMGSDRPALVVEGGNITAGQRVAIVEAMKIKKEVFSAVTGKVVKIHVRDGDAVEYGQELFSVKPDDPDKAD
ncbi:MAG: hypothetical protein A2901_09275 [Elusimicrobia bacterium RIFCSPLOWO2_01_FULL_54_10]|nr:MAG: hypothetical protein A2901_09275 [Elusimicrobia bacterium RIFCSPLOWO2_01_FULL_54_10]